MEIWPCVRRMIDLYNIHELQWKIRGSKHCGGEIFRTHPGGCLCPPSLLKKGTGVLSAVKRKGHDADHWNPSSAEVTSLGLLCGSLAYFFILIGKQVLIYRNVVIWLCSVLYAPQSAVSPASACISRVKSVSLIQTISLPRTCNSGEYDQLTMVVMTTNFGLNQLPPHSIVGLM